MGLGNVDSHSLRAETFPLDLELAKPHDGNIVTTDYYEILRVGPQADEETIERVYRTLADRFHPDNPGTGDADTFLRICEAYETLSHPAKRAKYNVLRQHNRSLERFWLRGREFFDGVRGGQNRRLAVLCLLYRHRISAQESPGLTILDLELLTGCTREEVTSALWYLCQKKWSKIGDSTAYSITGEGFDVVESKLEERLEFRALATVSGYSSSAVAKDTAHGEPSFWKDTLPLYLDPARTLEEDALLPDHYGVLGIGPRADEEVIERVYRTLAGRFHPDNPGTGDANTFQRITDAYQTLSDHARRAQYDAVRERTKHSSRFRLQGREFFDGIKGEQLRRLAVLCLLYRQSTNESSGLTVLDLEQLTGCTREELSSALWYLREKKWAECGEYTEYCITAAGFDVVENAAQTAAQNQLNATVTHHAPLHTPVLNTIAPVARNSRLIVESAPIEIKAAEVPKEMEITQLPASIEATGEAERAGWFGRGAKAEEPEATGSWAWMLSDLPDATDGNEFESPPQASATQPVRQNQQSIPATPEYQAPNTVVLENQSHHADGATVVEFPRAAESEPKAIKVEAPSHPHTEFTPQSPTVAVSKSTEATAPQASELAVSARKRVILSMGGKGGVGKTSVMTGLAEWFGENRIPVTLLDLDIENKAIGSLAHFFTGRVPKINIHTPAGLDAFVDNLAEDSPVILADMGAGSGLITHDWFDKMYPDVAEAGVVFTAIGVVTSDPASVESVLNWATALQDRVSYVIVRNNLTERPDFTYWEENDLALDFRKRFQPAIIRLDYRLADLENAVRNHGVTLGQVANRTATAPELQKASLVMRAQSYRRRMFAEFDKVKELLLP